MQSPLNGNFCNHLFCGKHVLGERIIYKNTTFAPKLIKDDSR